jgi:PIN domain nuclease of toxin-antitoxin system
MWLVDTQLLVWAAYDAARLPRSAARELQSRDQRLIFSLASVWEVAIKSSLQRADFSVQPAELHRALLAEGFVELAILPSHIVHLATLPWLHRDPFDRMLVAQAMVEALTLLTADKGLKGYGSFVRAV